ncbi:helix-turn-helix transcriptional regulator [uncultured Parabacteroides sp.]|uniref:AraC family transcriptional regulator n=1 Tax=uncultured Parabacteroides sp. TaxID=512312 RepID=UPI002616EBBF|nr:helix-turn-helix transcriptional regulator [uncultured Parabacteroides sp.]
MIPYNKYGYNYHYFSSYGKRHSHGLHSGDFDYFRDQTNRTGEMENIIIKNTLQELGVNEYSDYLAHALCTEGKCTFVFNGKIFDFAAGDSIIIRKGKLVEKISPSVDFRVKVVYVTPAFIEACTPLSNYGMKGQLALFLNPVMHLDGEQAARLLRDMENIEFRMSDKEHHFYRDILINAVQTMILDFFDFHSHLYGEKTITTAYASTMLRFIQMLERGDYRYNREVSYYASELCVSPKYLTEVSNKTSGYSANYWINRYTILEISRLLRDKTLTYVNISNMFGFSSPAYFSRYVQTYLGMRPSEYRD